ncbi:DUF5681 domain-containing protein [Aliagarivorans taiwanensis]|uniref:DUF5681 domain-containing protein n=1 Tax=Aliagarivorans taiwanensis TaxID=561966 RepID=UPI00041ED858|nr:DUF5681 domain-containing protein [Aliagarivorans taiwanensis]
MPFEKGQSGNPAGRPKGSTERQKLIAAIERKCGSMDEFWESLVGLAEDGNAQIASMLASKLCPALKPTMAPIRFNFPEGSVAERAGAVLEAVASGEISPDVGVAVLGATHSYFKILEVDELQNRINRIEQALEANK